MSPRAKSLWVLAALTAANFFGYASRNALLSDYADLRSRWTVSESDIGLIATAFMAGQALATLPFGWAGDRFRRQRVIMVGLLIAGVASVAGSIGPLAGRFDMLLLTRALVGVGTAAIVPVANSILSQLFDGPRKASKIAVFNVGLFLGGAAGFVGGDSPGYPLILLLTGAPMIAVALWVGALDIPSRRSVLGGASALPEVRRELQLGALLLVILSATFMAFAVQGLVTWLKYFLVRYKSMSGASANTLMILSMVGALAGIIVGARVGDTWRRRHVAGRPFTVALAMTMTVPFVAASILVPNGLILYIVSTLAMFFLSWYHAPLAATVGDVAPGHLSARAQAGCTFTMHLIGTAPASWVVGMLATKHGLQTALWLPVSCIGLAAICMLLAGMRMSVLQPDA
jgi:MFS transporter, Spinster family, sphingosine-1-phosphate transporter